ncbi:uncharacterized protein LTR77_011048 [Saxophila tyrrhenica]|uniref:Uncharacterized protein n=1 Tax=Saxophila tyrrhenica TaxID=1690608 RepID=A0AAV9NXL2_9PEZI|nr:hypothetical protein LTR77_011048 [Saxophila tyrrhenica]
MANTIEDIFTTLMVEIAVGMGLQAISRDNPSEVTITAGGRIVTSGGTRNPIRVIRIILPEGKIEMRTTAGVTESTQAGLVRQNIAEANGGTQRQVSTVTTVLPKKSTGMMATAGAIGSCQARLVRQIIAEEAIAHAMSLEIDEAPGGRECALRTAGRLKRTVGEVQRPQRSDTTNRHHGKLKSRRILRTKGVILLETVLLATRSLSIGLRSVLRSFFGIKIYQQ